MKMGTHGDEWPASKVISKKDMTVKTQKYEELGKAKDLKQGPLPDGLRERGMGLSTNFNKEGWNAGQCLKGK